MVHVTADYVIDQLGTTSSNVSTRSDTALGAFDGLTATLGQYMCGIALLLSPTKQGHSNQPCLCECWSSIVDNVSRRGPDGTEVYSLALRTYDLKLASSVLSLRGKDLKPTVQPLRSSASESSRFWLCWNGQVFDWSNDAESYGRIEEGANDGQVLFDQLCSAATVSNAREAVVSTLSQIEGPYAFVFIDLEEKIAVFGRDPLGRRSLLLCHDEAWTHIAIVSVTSQASLDLGQSSVELSCDSLWILDLDQGPQSLTTLPRNQSTLLLRELQLFGSTNSGEMVDEDHVTQFGEVLSRSVRQRVTNIDTKQDPAQPHLAILFSGGLDCTTLALLASQHVPSDQPIDLLNVAFENPRAIQAAKRLKEREALARAARTAKANGRYQHTGVASSTPAEAENANGQEDLFDVYLVPDRVTGRASYSELCRLNPRREWRFVEINVPYNDYCEAKPIVEVLMSPSDSVIDLSIASALYFASQSLGTLGEEGAPYVSPAKVLLSGLGADELLGGYSRHRSAFVKSGKQGLVQELQMDLDRLPERNLGRDDRVLSHHGKEARYPFLDRSVVQFLTSIPIEAKVNLNTIGTDGAGGDKVLLRNLAKRLGLVEASQLKKRAMQFGTRVAKIDENSRHAKGHHSVR